MRTPEGERAQRILDWVNEAPDGSRVTEGKARVSALAASIMEAAPLSRALSEVRGVYTVLDRLRPSVSYGLSQQLELSRFGSDAEFLARFHLRRGEHGKFASMGAGKPEASFPVGRKQSVRDALYGMRHPAGASPPALPQRNPQSPAALEIGRGIAKRRELAKLEARSGPSPARAPSPGFSRTAKGPHERAIERAQAKGRLTSPKDVLRAQAEESGTSPGSHRATEASLDAALRKMGDQLSGLNLEGEQGKQLTALLRQQADVNRALAEALHASRQSEHRQHMRVSELQRELRKSELREQASVAHEEQRAKKAEAKARAREEVRSIKDEVRTNNLIATGGVIGALVGITHFVLSLHGQPIDEEMIMGVIAPMIDAAAGAAAPALLVAARARKKLREARKKQKATGLAGDAVRDSAQRLVTRMFASALVSKGLSELEAAAATREAMSHAA